MLAAATTLKLELKVVGILAKCFGKQVEVGVYTKVRSG
jgi:hypothetical protein